MEIEKKLKSLPQGPGVYIMKDKEGKIIYIGKAVNLRNRVRSYFRASSDERYFVSQLSDILGDIETIVTRNEAEALLLEGTLIRKHKPQFNIEIRSEGYYLYVRIDTEKEFSRFELVRKRRNDKALYFGPYYSARAIRETSHMLGRIFGMRTCSDSVLKSRKKPCIEYQIGRCLAPCAGLVSKSDYEESVQRVIAFLSGKKRELISVIKEKMQKAASDLNFELAAKMRDTLKNIETTMSDQIIILNKSYNVDVIAIEQQDEMAIISLCKVMEGLVAGINNFVLKDIHIPVDEILSAFLSQHYLFGFGLKYLNNLNDLNYLNSLLPDEIILPFLPEGTVGFASILNHKSGKKIKLKTPSGETRKKLYDLALKNAKKTMDEQIDSAKKNKKILEMLMKELKLKKFPQRIECYDISNIQGMDAYGSMAVFIDGTATKKEYRCFKIKSKQTPDDFKMMEEVLTRRFHKASSLPDLVIIDGGRAHLSIAERVCKETNIDVDLISIAKERRGENVKRERLYLLDTRRKPLIPENKEILHLIMRIRDEAHRFALKLHRKGRAKKKWISVLDQIPFVGRMKKKSLLLHFGSVKNLVEANIEEIVKVKGINKQIAMKIYEYFHGTSVSKK